MLIINPYELGRSHREQGLKSQNPFEEFSGKWAQYNIGYNYQWKVLSS